MKIISLCLCIIATTASFNALSDTEVLKSVKSAPAILCGDSADKTTCERGIKALMKAVNNYSSLNEQCQAKAHLRNKMDDQTRYQCDSAKEVTQYLEDISI